MRPLVIDGKNMSPRMVATAVRSRGKVELDPGALLRVAEAHAVVQGLGSQRAVYGQTSGVGANRGISVDQDPLAHARDLVASHAVTLGPAVDLTIERAMLLIRLNQLAVGGSGVSPAILEALSEAINRNLTPGVRKYASIGTGDLGALATLALCLSGERSWQGGAMPAVTIGLTDALAIMSSSAATLGESALACFDLQTLASTALTIAALSFIATGGSNEAFAAEVHQARPHSGARAVAAQLDKLLEDIQISPKRLQDPYAFRAIPSVHGALVQALWQLDQTICVDMNSATENPYVSTIQTQIFHHGNFHTAELALALDKTRAALFQAAALSVARLSALMDPGLTGARRFLAIGAAANSGLLILEYVAHSALADLRSLAAPVTLGSAVLSLGAEEHASFATQAAWRLTDSVAPFEVILACELFAATTALLGQDPLPGQTGDLLLRARPIISTNLNQVSLSEQLASVQSLVRAN